MRVFISLVLFFCVVPLPARATFSIIACDPTTGTCGVAVASNNLAVGASVCYAAAGTGAIVSQYETNPNYGPLGLDLLKENAEVDNVLMHLLENDNNFEGLGTEFRQVALVSVSGETAVHSGQYVMDSMWAGARSGLNYSVQGNGLAGEQVLLAMEASFRKSVGRPLAKRLMLALIAGQEAGGQRTGTLSAALLVRTVDGWPFDVDLRVDASDSPVKDLSNLLDFHYARQAIIRAERHARQGDQGEVWNALAEALQLGAGWDRVWRRAARLAMELDEPERALDYLAVFMSINPVWAREEILLERYASLEKYPVFQNWLENSQ